MTDKPDSSPLEMAFGASNPLAFWSTMAESGWAAWNEAMADLTAQNVQMWSHMIHPYWHHLYERHWQYEVPEELEKSDHPNLFA